MTQHPIVLFDGVCNFCNSAINLVIKNDKKETIRYTPLQSTAGQLLLQQYQLPLSCMKSFIFIDNGKVYTKSTAALQVAKRMKGAWPLLFGFIIIPKFIRDGVYDYIATNRYKWFGAQQQCMVPTEAVRSKFLV